MTAAVTVLDDTEPLVRRLADLRALAVQVDEEIVLTVDRLERMTRVYTPRGQQPPCGTEEGYQWHRYHDRDAWPLPVADPCGCRAAHNQRTRVRHIRSGRRRAARRPSGGD